MKPVALVQHDKTQRAGVLLHYLEEIGARSLILCPEEGDGIPRHAHEGGERTGGPARGTDPVATGSPPAAPSPDLPSRLHALGLSAEAAAGRVLPRTFRSARV